MLFDVHTHAGPDVVDRLAEDLAIGEMYRAAGFEGFVLKAHYESTVGRAAAVARSTGLRVVGGLALNQHVGGINVEAVQAALLSGARVIWMPTADSHTQATAGLPRLCGLDPRLSAESFAIPPVDDSSAGKVRTILEIIAESDAVLATGHVSTEEVQWLLPVARDAGVRRIILTHPSYTVPAMSAEHAKSLADTYGALVEVTCYQLLHQPGMSAPILAQYIREVGIHNCVLSSDAGQPDSPPPPAAVHLLVDALAGEGLRRSELEAAAGARASDLILD